MAVRTRIAPSPTGEPHVGTAYVALFNYAFAKKHGGSFVLRIEDTDQVRSRRVFEDQIVEALTWLGIIPDEGPGVGGPYGPYRQSERREIYAKYAEALLAQGGAFRCFCAEERLTALRDEQMRKGIRVGYDGACINLPRDEVERRVAAGEPYVIRLRVPESGQCVVRDVLRGEISFAWNEVDMAVLVKSDGMPTYHFANVVDDHLMKITHVIRGEEWISSLPKHVLLYERFGWAPPAFCHLPLLRNPDRSKLSKRKNPTNVLYYRQIGILPEALKNYLGLMGWSMPDGRELFTIDEMVEAFSLERISLGGPVFDLAKLEWLNGRWMREKLTGDALYERVLDWMNLGDRMRRAVALAQPRAQRLTDVMGLIGFLFQGEIVMREDLIPQGDERAAAISLYDDVITRIAEMEEWNRDAIERLLRAVAESRGEKLRSIVQPLYLALTGSRTSIPLFEAMEFLGKDVCRQRLRTARDLLDKKSQESNS